MTNNTGYSYRESREILLPAPEQKFVKKPQLFLLVNSIWQYIVSVLAQGQQPRVWQSCDRFGQTWWHGYDPATGRSICRDSEDKIRVWLEERYYR
ncbi:MAG: hypothetical protein AB1589_34330 [Cyanobacteriota bacterium]